MSAVTTTTASELREAFKLFDADDNGEVTVAELNKYAQRNKHCKFFFLGSETIEANKNKRFEDFSIFQWYASLVRGHL